jgi:hypothetical protein
MSYKGITNQGKGTAKKDILKMNRNITNVVKKTKLHMSASEREEHTPSNTDSEDMARFITEI